MSKETSTPSALHTEQQDSVLIVLDEPIKRGATEIKEVTIRRPNSGALRGVSMIDVININVTALQTVLPRITEPTLTREDVLDINVADLMEMGVALASFLARKEMRKSFSH